MDKAAGVLTMDSIISLLGSIKAYGLAAGGLESETAACAEAVKILYVLSESGVHTAEEAKDLVYDYNALAKQYQAMHKRFGTAGHAVYKDSVWHCPNCNRRVNPGHSFCRYYGKKLDWGAARKGGRRNG